MAVSRVTVPERIPGRVFLPKRLPGLSFPPLCADGEAWLVQVRAVSRS